MWRFVWGSVIRARRGGGSVSGGQARVKDVGWCFVWVEYGGCTYLYNGGQAGEAACWSSRGIACMGERVGLGLGQMAAAKA